jgi:hypothetical protein
VCNQRIAQRGFPVIDVCEHANVSYSRRVSLERRQALDGAVHAAAAATAAADAPLTTATLVLVVYLVVVARYTHAE